MLHISNISALLKHGKYSLFFPAYFFSNLSMAKLLKPFEIQDTTTQGASEAYHIGRQRFRFHLVQPWRAAWSCAAAEQAKII